MESVDSFRAALIRVDFFAELEGTLEVPTSVVEATRADRRYSEVVQDPDSQAVVRHARCLDGPQAALQFAFAALGVSTPGQRDSNKPCRLETEGVVGRQFAVHDRRGLKSLGKRVARLASCE